MLHATEVFAWSGLSRLGASRLGLVTWRASDAESDDPGYVISRRKGSDFVGEVQVEGEKRPLEYADRPKAPPDLVRRSYIERRPWDVWG